MNDTQRLVPIGEAARLLGVSVPTLREWDRSGRLRALRLPASGRRAYREDDLRRFLEGLEHEATQGSHHWARHPDGMGV